MELPNNRVQNMLGLQSVVRSNTKRDDARLVRGAPPTYNNPVQMQQQQSVANQIGSMGDEEKSDLINKSVELAVKESLLERAGIGEDKINAALQDLMGVAMPSTPTPTPRTIRTAQGGLIGMAEGGKFSGMVPGQGHGMQDNVYMPIRDNGRQVATLAVSPKEYVVDAHTMSALGNGNAREGAKVMDHVVKNVRRRAYGTDQQPNQINGLAALRPMMERV
jgi:hypothetical protein